METNTITANLKDKQLKYVVTKNKNMIELLKNNGDLIIYEPNSDSINTEGYKENTYRELWVGDYFISGGFGAKSKEELDEFRRLSYSYINLSSQIDELSNKIDMKLDTFGGDLSYTYIPWVNQNTIQGYELYNRIKEIKSQPQLEINSILYKCDFELPNGEFYSDTGNYINIPYNSRLKNLTFIINGSYEYGINTIQIIMDDSIKDNNIIINNNDTDSNFEITIEIKDIVSKLIHPIRIKKGENNIIKSIKITTNTNKGDDFEKIYKNIYPLYPLTINGISSFIFAYNNTGDVHNTLLSNLNNYYTDIYNLQITNYQMYWNDNNEYILNLNNDSVKDISFLLNKNTQIIEAIYVDLSNNYYTSNIIDFLLPIKEIFYNTTRYIQYIINPNLGEKNKQYDPKINPTFLNFHSDNNNQYFTFNQGQIILKVSISNIIKYFNQDEINKFKLQYPNQYWISYNEDYYQYKYTYSYTYSYTYTYYYSIPYLPI